MAIATSSTRSPWRLGTTITLITMLACGPQITLEGGGSSDDGPTASTTTTPTTPPVTSTTITTSGLDTSTGVSTVPDTDFIEDPDGGGPTGDCSTFEQNCPRGYKCMPWATDGGTKWNATRCTPVVDDPDGLGEPCTVQDGPTSGFDSCDVPLMCFYVDPRILEGVCMPLCSGTPSEPGCPFMDYHCALSANSTVALCLADCHPLMPDACTPDQVCYPSNADFECGPTVDMPLPPGAPCQYVNECVPGAFCANDVAVPDCLGLGCCSAFCDLNDPMPACLPGQECLPWYEVGMAPAGYETLGACVLPMP